MYCEGCGESISPDANFCPRCGRKVQQSAEPRPPANGIPESGHHSLGTLPDSSSAMVTAQGNESGKRQSFWVSLFDWRMSDQELRRQLENYGALGWTWSYRKLSAALIWFPWHSQSCFGSSGTSTQKLSPWTWSYTWHFRSSFTEATDGRSSPQWPCGRSRKDTSLRLLFQEINHRSTTF